MNVPPVNPPPVPQAAPPIAALPVPLSGRIRSSVPLRLLAVAALVLVTMIPMSMVRGLVSERWSRSSSVKREIASVWGERQTIAGPMLVVPYRHRWADDSGKVHEEIRKARFLPDELTIKGALAPERRQRGIFESVVYRADLTVEGSFSRPDFSAWGISDADVQWPLAVLTVGVNDLRGVRGAVSLDWDGRRLPFSPGSAEARIWTSGLTAPAPLTPLTSAPGAPLLHRFSFALGLNGSEELRALPMGRETLLELRSPWPSPSFSGAFLPESRTISAAGFEARWKVSWFGRSYPQRWRDCEAETVASGSAVKGSAFGVDLILPADGYQKTERSLKYGLLFVVLTFLTFLLYELLSPVSLHPVQYLMVGGALSLFYILLLSISEQAPFAAAYAIASAATVALIAGYAAAILRERRRALVLAGILGLLYGTLYVLLQAEDWALLLGSVALFAVLGLVMFLTRRIDWGAARLSGQTR